MNISTDVNAKVDSHSVILLGITLAIVASFIILMSKVSKRNG